MSLPHSFAQFGSRVLMTDAALCPVPLDGKEIASRKAQGSVLLGLLAILTLGDIVPWYFRHAHSAFSFLLSPFSLKDDL